MLNRAAKLLRERAEKAREASGSLSPWVVQYGSLTGYPQRVTNGAAVVVAETFEGGSSEDVVTFAALPEYVALVDWRVGLAVADLLEVLSFMPSASDPTDRSVAVALARAVLREGEGGECGNERSGQ